MAGLWDRESNVEQAILMSGPRLTDQQVRLYMTKRKHETEENAEVENSTTGASSRVAVTG